MPIFSFDNYPLHRVAQLGNKKVAELMIARGLDVNQKLMDMSTTPILVAIREGHTDLVKLFLTNGARVNDKYLLTAVSRGHKEIVELLLAQGVQASARMLHCAVQNGYKEIVELLLAIGIHVNATMLHSAVKNGWDEIVEILLANGAKSTPYVAALRGDIAAVKEYLEQGMDVNAKDEYYHCTLLHEAAAAGHKEMTEFLIERGAEINIRDKCMETPTPLYKAVKNGHKHIAELLIARGAEVNAKFAREVSPLHLVTSQEIAELLIANGAQVNAENRDGFTPLHLAVRNGYKDVVQCLIERGATSFTSNNEGNTPLHEAVNREIAELILANGANINARNKRGLTPFGEAVQHQRQDIVNLLISRGANVNFDRDMKASLLYYSKIGCTDVVKLLISKGAEVNPKDRAGVSFSELNNYWPRLGQDYTPLHSAVIGGHQDVVECLIAGGARIDVYDRRYGLTPLHWAVWESHKEVVALLLANGADINAKRTVGGLYTDSEKPSSIDPILWISSTGTPLHLVWDKDIAAFLIANGADVDARDKEFGNTPLHVVTEKFFGDVEEITELLILNGADVNAKNKSGRTPLHNAVERGYKEVVKYLIANDANVNAKDESYLTTLHEAIRSVNRENLLMTEEIVELLILKGADVNAKDKSGATPLHYAVSNGLKNLVEYLLASDADVNVQDIKSLTPLDEALSNSQNQIFTEPLEIAELLVANGAQINPKNAKQISQLISLNEAWAKEYWSLAEIFESAD